MKESNGLRKLSADEYIAEEKKLWERYSEYIQKKIDINKREKKEIDEVTHGYGDLKDKVDVYFETQKESAEKYEKEREELKKEYQRYTSIYETDFYTELTEEFLEKCERSDANKKTIESLLDEIKNLKSKYFISGKENKKYKCKFIAVQVDDFYYVGISDDGEYCWHSCVGKPRFIN